MKTKKIISVVVAILVVVAGALLLVFLPKNEKSDQTEHPKTVPTNLFVDLLDTINIMVGTKVKIDKDAIVVTPKDRAGQLKHEVIVKSGGSMGGVTFDGQVITATKTGKYAIKFSIPKTELSMVTKTINVLVYDDSTQTHTKQVKNEMTCEDSESVFDIFTNLESKDFFIQSDNKVKIVNNILTAEQAGESSLIVTFMEGNLSYVYNFKLSIKAIPEYYIVLNGVVNNSIEVDFSSTKNKFLTYEVYDKNNALVEQLVSIQSDNEAVATGICDRTGIIKISILSRGKVTLTISPLADESIKAYLTVVVT